jgi:predicted ATPase
VLTPEQLLDRLNERLPLLRSSARDAPERHRTLRATIAWSYDLLDADEQRLLRRLAGFPGGCTLDAVEQVADADIDVLESLVDRSLVRRTSDRFWMLETIREYALEQLRRSGEEADIARACTQYYLELAYRAHLRPEDFDLGQQPELVLPEMANLRAAIDRAVDAGDVELALEITSALEQFWIMTSPHEGIRRLQGLLDAATDAPRVLQARAWRALGAATYITGEFDAGTRHYNQAIELFREIGDEAAVGHLMFRNAVDAQRRGDTAEARRLLEESRVLSRSRADEAQALSLLGDFAYAEGQHRRGVGPLRTQRAGRGGGEVRLVAIAHAAAGGGLRQ